MKKIILLLPGLLIPLLSACSSNGPQVKLLQGNHVSSPIGETVDFNKYISYPEGSKYVSTYTTPSNETKTARTMFYTLDEAGDYSFSFNFTLPSSSIENINLTLTMLPSAPSVKQAKYTVKVDKNVTLTYAEMLKQSELSATPVGYVNFLFKQVEYIDEFISVENYEYSKTTTLLDASKTDFTFTEYGSYKFLVEISNISGSEQAYLNVTCYNGKAFSDELSVDGAIIGNDSDTTVKLLAPSTIGEVSYLAYKEQYSMNIGEYFTTEVKFKGQNAPQLMFFSDTLDGKITVGEGFIVSTEGATPYDRFRIFGPERLKNDIPLTDRERTISRDGFISNKVYLMRIIVTKLDASHCAVKAVLYVIENNVYTLQATFNWASFEYQNSLENRYIVFLGSSLGDIIFNFTKPYQSDKYGARI